MDRGRIQVSEGRRRSTTQVWYKLTLTLTLVLAKHFFLLRHAHNAIRILISALLSPAGPYRVF